MFVRLKEASEAEKRPMNQIINEALEAYFSQKS
jgi:sulfite reductase (ferredoxin)